MKQCIIALTLILSFSFAAAQAQTYKINKYNYDYRMYMPMPGDANNPGVMGLASFFIPGLGQMLCGETGRGLAFLGSSVALKGIAIAGYSLGTDWVETHHGWGTHAHYETSTTGIIVMVTGLAAAVAVDLWSIVDAVRVAKVNNMYIQDVRNNMSNISIELNPFVDSNNYLGQNNTSAGLSMKIVF